ncbi:hypothetical protein HHI36_021571 [Cryptolaemus montrouzieri]|uniref:WD repeat-containing protein 18 n=1 Tax=Cryptolaemus montrouzieri TaxID=559131 RepID=A0ABD2MXY4_9CUCU
MDREELLMSTCESNKPYTINLWDWKTTNSVFHYKNGSSISPHLIAQLGNDYIIGGNIKEPKLYLWQYNNQEPLKKFRLILPEIASCLNVCPRGYYLAAGIKTDLYIWQLGSGKLLTVQRKNYQPITVVKFSTCGDFLIVGGQDGIINTYKFVDLVCLNKNSLAQSNIGQTEPLYTRDHHNYPITDIHVGNFGRKSRFATCSIDQTVKIYELFTGKLLLNLVFQNAVHSVIFDAPCWNLYVGCSNGVLQMFKLTDPPREVNHHVDKNLIFEGHKKSVKCLCLNLSENILASGDDDGLILIWEISSRQVLKKIEQNSPITNLRFILNHKNILSQEFKVTTALRDLEMQIDLNETNFPVTIIQSVDVENPDEQCLEEQKHSKMKLEQENEYLRATNQHLYQYALQLLQNKT